MYKWLYLAFPALLFSAPIGPPSSPSILEQGFFIADTSWASVRTGYTQDFLLYQKLESSQAKHSGIQGVSSLGSISWNIKERLDLQFVSGSGQISWNFIQNNGAFISGQSTSSWIWGGGAKVVLLEVQDTSLSVLGSGGYWQRIEGFYSSNGKPQKIPTHLKMRYWQLGAGITQKIGRFYPYFGCAIQKNRLRMRLNSGLVILNQDHRIGPFLGCTLTKGIKYMLNLEWRGFFEQALTGSCEVRF
ncbi:MAG: hypothetical protein JSS32_01460 [Verrucomicrobia bacterium]|nr:hypothetical protein [Verrucomicrobiota bacterium]